MILVVFPTEGEGGGFCEFLGLPEGERTLRIIKHSPNQVKAQKTLDIEVFVTGIGMVNTALKLGRKLMESKPEWVIQAGIAGSFSPEIPIGSVVEIREDIFAEMGAESPEGFLDLQTLGFSLMENGQGKIYNSITNPYPPIPGLRGAKGITVNKVHGIAESIAVIQQRWSPEVESMEGAAFFQTCLEAGVRFSALRGISNWVEPRNRANWRIEPALHAIFDALDEIFKNELNEY